MDDLSSAHVYLRQKPGEKLDDITEDLLLDCSSLVKANSISGCKVRAFQMHRMHYFEYTIPLVCFSFIPQKKGERMIVSGSPNDPT